MDNFIITTVYLLIGIVLKRTRRFPDDTGNVLSLFAITVSLPALVLLKIPELTFSMDLLTPVLMPWIMLTLSAVGVLGFGRLCKWERQTIGCLLLLIPLGNTSFLGIPMVRAFFGDQAIPYAVLYDQLGSFLALGTYGSVVLALYGSETDHATIASTLKKITTFPPFMALVLAFALKPVTYPDVITSLLNTLGATLVPVVMIAVGFQLSFSMKRAMALPLASGLTLKLVVAPAIALGLCRTMGLQGEVVNVSIFEAGMPPMVSAGALAIMAGLSPALAAALVGSGIILSFVTLPLLYYVL
ncbi:MAG: AEC family transporter [Planctomycetes bacterium]|nr:AEC family transporter [Planctomycetota bacterium]